MKKVTRQLILFTLFLLLTSQSVHAEPNREIARLGRGAATSLDWRPDGNALAVGSATGVWFYNENLTPIGHLAVGNVHEVVWDNSGKKIAIVNADANKTLQVWQISEDIIKQEQIWTQTWLDKQWSPIQIAWEPNGQRLVTGSEDDSVHIWDASNGNLMTKLPAKGNYVAWSPDGAKIAVSDNEVKIVNASSLKITTALSQFSAGGKISWNVDGSLLASDCNDTEKFTDFWGQCIWDAKTYKLMYSQELARIAWSSNSSRFVFFGTSGFDSVVTWLEIHNLLSTEASNQTSYSAFFIDLKWQPNKEILVALAADGTLLKYDINTQKFSNSLTYFTNEAQKLVWSPDNHFIISTQNETQQLVWDMQSQGLISDALISLNRQIGTYGPRQTQAVWQDKASFWSISQAGDWEGRVANYVDKYDAKTGENTDILIQIITNCWFVFNNDLSQAACLQPDKNEFEIWNIKSKSVDFTISIADYPQFYWSPDDGMIAIMNSNADEMSTTLEIWDVKTRKRISEFKTYGTAINNFTWSFDSQKFVFELSTASVYGIVNSVRIYQLADTDYKHGIELPNISDDVDSLLWSQDDQKLFVATHQSIDIYQTTDLSKIGELKHPPTKVLSLSSDDKLLALGMDDGTIHIWDVADLLLT